MYKFIFALLFLIQILMLRYTSLTARCRKEIKLYWYVHILFWYVTCCSRCMQHVLLRQREKERSIAGESRPHEDTGETVQKNCEARAALTITMRKIFYARIHLRGKKNFTFVLRFHENSSLKNICFTKIYIYILICMKYLKNFKNWEKKVFFLSNYCNLWLCLLIPYQHLF